MKPIKTILHLTIIISFFLSCNSSSIPATEQVSNDQEVPIAETDNLEKADLTDFSKEDLARYAMSSIMGQPSKDIKVRFENELYYVSYVRKSDSKKFDYKIKINGNTIVWANIDGRWRDAEYDERVSYEESNNKLKIIQTFNDGSVDIKEYKESE